MSKTNFKNVARNKQYVESIRSMIRAIAFEEDPRELDAYRKLIRKNVSIFRRTYLAAYLFKTAQAGNASFGNTKYRERNTREASREGREGRRRDNRQERGRNRQRDDRAPKKPIPNAQNGIVSLHINCGRMHGLTEDELRSLIQSSTSTEVIESIKDVRVHDKYTFVYLADKHAQTIIDKINGSDRFSRSLHVSYSKKNIQQ